MSIYFSYLWNLGRPRRWFLYRLFQWNNFRSHIFLRDWIYDHRKFSSHLPRQWNLELCHTAFLLYERSPKIDNYFICIKYCCQYWERERERERESEWKLLYCNKPHYANNVEVSLISVGAADAKRLYSDIACLLGSFNNKEEPHHIIHYI